MSVKQSFPVVRIRKIGRPAKIVLQDMKFIVIELLPERRGIVTCEVGGTEILTGDQRILLAGGRILLGNRAFEVLIGCGFAQ